MSTLDDVKDLLDDALQLRGRAAGLNAESPLLGAMPELDSMAVLNVINGMEERFGFVVGDDEISADTFATLSSLAAFVDQKRSA